MCKLQNFFNGKQGEHIVTTFLWRIKCLQYEADRLWMSSAEVKSVWNFNCTYAICIDSVVVRHIDNSTLLHFYHFTFVFKYLRFIFSSEVSAESTTLHCLNWIVKLCLNFSDTIWRWRSCVDIPSLTLGSTRWHSKRTHMPFLTSSLCCVCRRWNGKQFIWF